MVLALALFVAGAAMLTQLNSSVARSLERSRLSIESADLARKALAELEAGIITIADVRTARLHTEQSVGRMDRAADMDELAEPSPWQVSVRTERSPYSGLTLVELTVAYVGEARASSAMRGFSTDVPDDSEEVRTTIRQLMRLRDDSASAEGSGEVGL